MKNVPAFLAVFLSLVLARGQEVQRVSLPKPKDMTLADVIMVNTVKSPKAVLVLCPGFNGSGEGMIRQKDWQDFALKNRLGLMGIHFQSPIELLAQCQGYYQTQNGSGEVLLTAVKKIYGEDLPLLLFGFSGGAHFTTRFIEWKPGRVLGWCALGAGVLDKPEGSGTRPPGMMACGEEDERLGGALIFFKQGRAVGRPWLFSCLPGVEHSMSSKLEMFVSEYFEEILSGNERHGVWVDVDGREIISVEKAAANPSLSGWLPDQKLFKSWKKLNEK